MEEPVRVLNERGFETLNLPYPSFRKTLDEIVDQVARQIPPSSKPTHFVTHSMGGIVLRLLAKRYPELVTGKIVMLAPPNQGSEIIDWLEEFPLARWSLGPGGISLSTDRVPKEVPELENDDEVFVLMGRKNTVPIFDFLLKGKNDGVVTVEGGRIKGMSRLEVFDADHTFIMGDDRVLQRVAELLTD